MALLSDLWSCRERLPMPCFERKPGGVDTISHGKTHDAGLGEFPA